MTDQLVQLQLLRSARILGKAFQSFVHCLFIAVIASFSKTPQIFPPGKYDADKIFLLNIFQSQNTTSADAITHNVFHIRMAERKAKFNFKKAMDFNLKEDYTNLWKQYFSSCHARNHEIFSLPIVGWLHYRFGVMLPGLPNTHKPCPPLFHRGLLMPFP